MACTPFLEIKRLFIFAFSLDQIGIVAELRNFRFHQGFVVRVMEKRLVKATCFIE